MKNEGGEEMKLREVERAAAEAVDTIPPPSPQLSAAPSSRCTEQAKGRSAQKEGRQGQVEEDLQIGHSPKETIINKAARARSPLEKH